MGWAYGDYSLLSSHIALMGERVWPDGGGVGRGSPTFLEGLGEWKESTGLGVRGVLIPGTLVVSRSHVFAKWHPEKAKFDS